MSAVYNVAIIGQTGVGKSALLNYIFGERVTKSGVGAPVTVKGFHAHECKIGGMDSVIYDSWGLEVGKEDVWLKDLEIELEKRTITASPSEWFHTVYYCIAASGARIQDCDIRIIERILNDDYKLTVVLTKADLISEEDELCLVNSIKQRLSDKINIIPVCSEGKKTRGGETKPFGKEEIERQAFIDVLDSLVERVPKHCEVMTLFHLNVRVNALIRRAEEEIGIFGFHDDKKLYDFVNSELESIHRRAFSDFNDYFKKACADYEVIFDAIYKKLNIKFDGAKNVINYKNSGGLEWWEWPLAIAIFPLYPILSPFMAKDQKQDIRSAIMKFKSDLIEKIKDFELQTKKELISLGVKLKNEKSL